MSELRRQAWRFVRSPRILVLLAPFVLLAPNWLAGKALYWGTPSTQFLPWWHQAWQTLRVGEWPLWNPLLGAGAPLLANYQSALLYPPTWFYFLLAEIGGLPWMAWGMAPLVAAHLAWAGLGMLQLVRRLGLGLLPQTVAGLAFGLSGYLVARAHFLSINAAVAWLPWILWAVYGLVARPGARRALMLAGLLALQWLAGHAQIAWYSLLLAAAWAAFWLAKQQDQDSRKRAGGLLLGAASLAFALAAAQLLPTLEYLLHSSRATEVGRTLALNYSFWPWRVLGLLAPNLFGSPAWNGYIGPGNYWEDAIYIGALPLLLALGALIMLRKQPEGRSLRTLLLIIVGLSLLLALGRYTTLYPWLYDHVPTFALFQAPARWTLWLVFALALLAAFGLDAWRRPTGRALYWSRLAVAGALALLLAAGAGWILRADLQLALPDSFLCASAYLGLLALLIALLNLRAPGTDARAAGFWPWAVALLVALDLLLIGWGLNPGVERQFYAQASAAPLDLDEGRIYLPRAEEQYLKYDRLFSFETFAIEGGGQALTDSLLPNMTLLAGLTSANNFDPLVPARYQDYLDALEGLAPDQRAAWLARLNVTVIQQAASNEEIIFAPVEALPRARWLPCARAVADAEAARVLLSSATMDLSQTVIVETLSPEADLLCSAGVQAGATVIVEQSANRVLVDVSAANAGWLILADTHYPGWRAYVDGQEATVYPADGLLRAVELPAGAGQVEFIYQPISFRVGAAFSLLGLMVMGGLWIRSRAYSSAGDSGK